MMPTKSSGSQRLSSEELNILEEPIEEYGPGGFHPVTLGDILHDRYIVVRKLGFGEYATVWLARDELEERFVSIKILKARETQKSGRTSEATILRRLLTLEGAAKDFIVTFLDHFTHSGPNGIHDCIVTEVLGQNIISLCQPGSAMLPFDLVSQIILQLTIAMDGLYACQIAHTDLKQDNILIYLPDISNVIEKFLQDTTPRLIQTAGFSVIRVVSEKIPTRVEDFRCIHVKLIDFGNAELVRKDEPFNRVLQCREFRAPEIFLEAPWDTSTDIWNLACLAWEMATSRSLFYRTPHDPDESRLSLMITYTGLFPANVIAAGKKSGMYFDAKGNFCQSNLPRVNLALSVKHHLSDKTDDWAEFARFLMLALSIDKDMRPTASELLKLPFFLNTRAKSHNPALSVRAGWLSGAVSGLLVVARTWIK